MIQILFIVGKEESSGKMNVAAQVNNYADVVV